MQGQLLAAGTLPVAIQCDARCTLALTWVLPRCESCKQFLHCLPTTCYCIAVSCSSAAHCHTAAHCMQPIFKSRSLSLPTALCISYTTIVL
ncbi:hypothetical protein PF001_g10370 [Phytophthora fragariae]|uniref:Uncharacterized protein n=1 Tax=Phytophthora fragariae TaxID=53985 RepID=A0A6A4DKQ2_9STRA|nr:hypothetical protein PF006_g10217 [Phytophthora fragariae]KAE9238028.1 hypothetical protein PF004_g8428 [Phytophthora fragariae]KAE9310122.1 hypothetical protein PF001_g10370 [Phytophthora fragariae]